MFTPITLRQRKALRTQIEKSNLGLKPKQIFDKYKMPKAPVISFRAISEWCKPIDIDPENLNNIFGSYGVTEPYLNLKQWESFMNDDFANYENEERYGQTLSEKQNFILTKFMGVMRTKFGSSMIDRWNHAIKRNPPNDSNVSLRVSSLCRIYQDTNLPFDASDFVDAIFAFYDEKLESLTFDQFSKLFSAYP